MKETCTRSPNESPTIIVPIHRYSVWLVCSLSEICFSQLNYLLWKNALSAGEDSLREKDITNPNFSKIISLMELKKSWHYSFGGKLKKLQLWKFLCVSIVKFQFHNRSELLVKKLIVFRFGRRPVFASGCILQIIMLNLLPFSPNYYVYCLFVVMNTFAGSLYYMTGFVIGKQSTVNSLKVEIPLS